MSPSSIPAEERQVNLLLALRNTVPGLTAAEVIATVAGYDPRGGPAARRMFERDKGVLRDLGISIRTSGAEDACRYSITEEDYALPEIALTATQAAAVDLAASAWHSGELTASARRALTKIRAVSQGAARAALPDLTLDLAGQEIPAGLAAAVDERRRVCFDYTSASSGRTRSRTVEPHALRMSEGAWYLDAHEPATGQRRTFRLARIRGGVTLLTDAGAFEVPQEDHEDEDRVALLGVAPGRALQLRARALPESASASPGQEDTAPLPAVPPGWEVIAVSYADRLAFAGSLAALGQGVVVLAPAGLRRDVLAHLHGAARLAPTTTSQEP